jgi:hypothetical protein
MLFTYRFHDLRNQKREAWAFDFYRGLRRPAPTISFDPGAEKS